MKSAQSEYEPDAGLLLSRAIKGIPGKIMGEVSATALTASINQYLTLWRLRGDNKPPCSEIIPERYIEILKRSGVTPDFIEQAAKVADGPYPDLLKDKVTKTIAGSLACIAGMMKKQIAEERMAIEMGKSETLEISRNAWFCASLVYASNKIGDINPNQKITNELGRTFQEYKELLFSDTMFRRDGEDCGWNDSPPDTHSDDSAPVTPMIHDTAFVGNILMKVDPDRNDDIYERCLRTLLRRRDSTGLWKDPHTGKVDLVGSAHILRFISNYVKFRPQEKVEKPAKEQLLKISIQICYALCDRMLDDGNWPANFDEGNPLENTVHVLTSAAVTALVIQALRDSNFPRRHSLVKKSCEWLIGGLECLDGIWCWTKPSKEKGFIPDPYTSAITVSALLKASTYSKFAKAEVVVDWLRQLVEGSEVLNSDPNDFVTIICALADYLRAWKIGDFYQDY